MIAINDLQAGKAGEYLVCADLILQGYVAFPSEQGLPFDVVAECNGRLLRIQVKTTREPVSGRGEGHLPFYLFNVRRMGKGGRQTYAAGMVDVFALVTLDTREIGYIAAKDVKQTMAFRISNLAGQYAGEKLRASYPQILALRESGTPISEIAKQFGISVHYAGQICNGRDISVKGLYLKDLTFERVASQLCF